MNGIQHGLLHRGGDGGVREERVGPGHYVAAGLLKVARALAHVGLGDAEKQAALEIAEFAVHFCLDIHSENLLMLKDAAYYSERAATASTSTSRPLGRVFTATQLRAGQGARKYSA